MVALFLFFLALTVLFFVVNPKVKKHVDYTHLTPEQRAIALCMNNKNNRD